MKPLHFYFVLGVGVRKLFIYNIYIYLCLYILYHFYFVNYFSSIFIDNIVKIFKKCIAVIFINILLDVLHLLNSWSERTVGLATVLAN